MQTWCKVLKELASKMWIKGLDKLTCIKPLDTLQQTCYRQDTAGYVNEF